MTDPDHVKRLEEQGLTIKPMVGEKFTKFHLEAHERARKRS